MIRTENLTRHYGSLIAVRNLDLAVMCGELFGFLGRNGAGKTTFIRMLAGLLRPTAGAAYVAGHNVQLEPLAAKQAVGYLAQSPLLYDSLTGREFLRFLGGVYGLGDQSIEARSNQLLELLELTDKADNLIGGYSGGMRHRIGLCGALLHEPQVLLLDEPLAGLDPYGARLVKDLLRDLCRKGCTVFLSTHAMEVVERLCTRVAILNRGQLVAVGSVEALRDQADFAVESSLEDVFLHMTGKVA
jgi:ABC-2 type transport system ATP-binding protein